MKNNNAFGYVICVVIGAILLGISVFLCRSYMTAEIKFKTTATLVKVDETERFKKDEKGKQQKYYEYTLTWEYPVKNKDLKIQYNTYSKKDYKGFYHEGAQNSISVYSNDGKNYYIQEWLVCIILAGIGLLFIVLGIGDYIFVTKRGKEQQNWQDVIKQRVEERQKQEQENKK